METKSHICSKCVMDTTDEHISFDENGVCDRCNTYEASVLPWWNYGNGHEEELRNIVDKIKKHGKGKKYDCILGLSGGFDSSYMLHFAVRELGLRPFVFHIDAGWDEPLAVANIERMVKKLGVDYHVEKIDEEEMRQFQLAFFRTGLACLDIPQDMAFVSVLDRYALKLGIKYILNGDNVSTEVIRNPKSWGRGGGGGTDMRFIKDVLKKHCDVKLKKYPFTNLIRRKIIIPYLFGVKTVKFLNLIPYVRKDAEDLLRREYDYIPYEQKHFEDILTKYIEGYWNPTRFGFDVRKPQFSSLILTGQMTREEALEKLSKPVFSDEEVKALTEIVAKRLNISVEELMQYHDMPIPTSEYKNTNWLYKLGAKIMFALKLDRTIKR